jgi:hypothetical protein
MAKIRAVYSFQRPVCFDTALPFRKLTAQKCQISLWVCVNEEHFFLWLEHRKGTADVKGGRSFANAAFVINCQCSTHREQFLTLR